MNDAEAALVDADAEAQLMASVRLGDRAAFRELYERFAHEVLAVCQRILDNHADAEDAAADVFAEVWRLRQRYDGRRSGARTYLVLLARSRAIDRLRSRGARPDRPAGAPVEETAAGAASTIRVDADPESHARTDEICTMVRTALDQLDARQRTAMELAFYEGLSHREIAERLHTPLGTVKTHIRKGLAKLRFSLAEERQGDEP